MFRTKYIVLALVLLVNSLKSDLPEQVVLTVYYESKCPDSKEFISRQLMPTLQLLHNYITLRLVPFGKAFSVDKRHFECQHGPSECLGNTVQSCTIDTLAAHVSDIDIAHYVDCEMETEAGAKGSLKCVQLAGADPNEVANCVNSRKGIELQLENEYLTKLVKPKFIPTITFEGESIVNQTKIVEMVFNQRIQDSALENLTATLCSYRRDIAPCANYYY